MIRGVHNSVAWLLLPLLLAGCTESEAVHTIPLRANDFQTVLAWQFPSDSEPVPGIAVRGRVHPDLSLVIRAQYLSYSPDRDSCGSFSFGAGRRLGITRSIDFVVESESFEVPILFDYVNPDDPVATKCTWVRSGTHFYIRDRASGRLLTSMTLVPFESMANFFNAKLLPAQIDFSCSASVVQRSRDSFAFGACEMALEEKGVNYFGVPDEFVTEFSGNSGAPEKFFTITIDQVP